MTFLEPAGAADGPGPLRGARIAVRDERQRQQLVERVERLGGIDSAALLAPAGVLRESEWLVVLMRDPGGLTLEGVLDAGGVDPRSAIAIGRAVLGALVALHGVAIWGGRIDASVVRIDVDGVVRLDARGFIWGPLFDAEGPVAQRNDLAATGELMRRCGARLASGAVAQLLDEGGLVNSGSARAALGLLDAAARSLTDMEAARQSLGARVRGLLERELAIRARGAPHAAAAGLPSGPPHRPPLDRQGAAPGAPPVATQGALGPPTPRPGGDGRELGGMAAAALRRATVAAMRRADAAARHAVAAVRSIAKPPGGGGRSAPRPPTAAGGALDPGGRSATRASSPAAVAAVAAALLVAIAVGAVLLIGGGRQASAPTTSRPSSTAAATAPAPSPTAAPTPLAPADPPSAGGVAAVALRPAGSCAAGSPCRVEVRVSLAAPSQQRVSWTIRIVDQCARSAVDVPGSTVETQQGWIYVLDQVTVQLPAGGHPLALYAVTTEPARAASPPLAVPGTQPGC